MPSNAYHCAYPCSMSMDMDITRLRHIIAVADAGSFSRAADLQHITQPALSRSVAAFERDAGLRLFDRSRGGAAITPAGEFVVSRARDVLRSIGELSRDVELYRKGAAGRVAFGMGPLLASLLLPRLGPRLLADTPQLEVSTVIRPPDMLLPDLQDDAIEMIFGNSWLLSDETGLGTQELARLELAVFARAGHPLAGRDRVSPLDLSAYPSARASRFSNDRGHAGAFICDNFHVLRETVLHSDCIWITATAFVRDDLAAGRLARLAVADMRMDETPIAVFTRIGRSLSPAAQNVVRLVRESLRQVASP